MSSTAILLQDYIERIAIILEANTTLFPVSPPNLVTKILRNKPPIEQSAVEAVVPYITIFESQTPLREMEVAGRDSRDAEGGRVWEVEIYCVAVAQTGITAQESQVFVNRLAQIIQDALGRNLRLTNPATGLSPLCRTHTRFQIPYLLSLNNPSMRAMNVVVRPQIYTSLR